MNIVIIVIVILFIFSYFKFIREDLYNRKLLMYMDFKHRMLLDDDIEVGLALCSTYTETFLYKLAYDQYEKILNTPELNNKISKDLYDKIKLNQQFCKSPLLWSSGPKNIVRFRYFHNFLLKRFGNRRYSFIREEDILEFNSYLRSRRN